MLRKVIVPTELADITLKDYQRFMGANPTDETFNQLALSIFCGIDAEEYPLFPKAQLEEIEALVQFTLNEKPALKRIIKIGDVEYGFHPNLEDLTTGEFIDAQEYLKDSIKNATKWLGVLYRPITQKAAGRYEIEAYNPAKHDGAAFEEITMDIVEGCRLFFTRLQLSLQIGTLLSLSPNPATKELRTSKASSLKNGDGLQSSINLLAEMYSIVRPSRISR
jgi:hypothetical protein